MRFVLRPDVLADASAFRDLWRILVKAADGWHLVAGGLDEVVASDWYAYLPAPEQEAARAVLTLAGAYAGQPGEPHRIAVEVRSAAIPPAAGGALSPNRARELAETALTVVVENRFTDRDFLRRAFLVLRPELLQFEELGALVFDSGGGIREARKLAEEHAQTAATRGLPPRAFVVIDSDRLYPSDTSSPGATASAAVEAAVRNAGLPVARLAKRTCENYVPDPVLVAWGEQNGKRLAVAALGTLTAEQRDHFPFGNGFAGIGRSDSPAVAALYAPVGPRERKALAQGIGKADPASVGEQSFLHPDWWRTVTPEMVRARAGGEIDALADRITEQM